MSTLQSQADGKLQQSRNREDRSSSVQRVQRKEKWSSAVTLTGFHITQKRGGMKQGELRQDLLNLYSMCHGIKGTN